LGHPLQHGRGVLVPDVGVALDAPAEARPVVHARLALRRHALAVLHLAARPELRRARGQVVGARLYVHGPHDVVAARRDVVRELGGVVDLGAKHGPRLGHAVVPKVVMRVNDWQLRLDHRLCNFLGKPRVHLGVGRVRTAQHGQWPRCGSGTRCRPHCRTLRQQFRHTHKAIGRCLMYRFAEGGRQLALHVALRGQVRLGGLLCFRIALLHSFPGTVFRANHALITTLGRAGALQERNAVRIAVSERAALALGGKRDFSTCSG